MILVVEFKSVVKVVEIFWGLSQGWVVVAGGVSVESESMGSPLAYI